MSAVSAIEWTDATWPIVQGCDYESPGCKNCYAVPLIWRLAHNPNPTISSKIQGLVRKQGDALVWTGKIALREDRLNWPMTWTAPRRIFVPSHGDLFHAGVPDAFIDRVFAVMALTPHHTYQVLTKRAARMRDWFANGAFDRVVLEMMGFTDAGHPTVKEMCARHGLPWTKPTSGNDWWPLRNVWLGASTERQEEANARIPLLLETPAAKRFLSAEPLLGPINLLKWFDPTGACCGGEPELKCNDCPADASWRFSGECTAESLNEPRLDWVIAGGESGPKAKPSHPDWFRALRDQCAGALVPFFFKQWGAWVADHHYCDPEAAEPEEPCDCRSGRECHITPSGHLHNDERDGQPDDRTWTMKRVGKKAAGALLDGREHREFPR